MLEILLQPIKYVLHLNNYEVENYQIVHSDYRSLASLKVDADKTIKAVSEVSDCCNHASVD